MRRIIIALLLLTQTAVGSFIALDLVTSQPLAMRHSFRLAERSLVNLEQLDALAEEHPTDQELIFAIAEPTEAYLKGNQQVSGWTGIYLVGTAVIVMGLLVLPRWVGPRKHSAV